MRRGISFVFLLVCTGGAFAQLRVSSQVEYQLGNLPHHSPKNYSTHYEQVNLRYRANTITAHLKWQNFTSPAAGRSYTELAQRSIEYNDRGLRLHIGHFYEMLGRGSLLRTYELPGVVLEHPAFRKRYGFYRDIDGVFLQYTTTKIDLKLLRGRPLNNTLPPGSDDSLLRPNVVEGGEAVVSVLDSWTVGVTYLRNTRENSVDEYAGFSVSGSLFNDLQGHIEYNQRLAGERLFLDLSPSTAHAFYSSVTALVGPIGLSYEYKDYNDFALGFNDPPPLVKEHQYLLLNRSTHVLLPQNETGWQLEALVSLPGNHKLTLNRTEALNQFAGLRYFFHEWFGEASLTLSDRSLTKWFVDFSEEPLFLITDRVTVGGYWEQEWPKLWGSSLDVEWQRYTLGGFDGRKAQDIAISLTLSRAPRFSLGVVWERSTNPGFTDDPRTPELETRARNWIGYSLGYQHDPSHFLTLFYGKRRGGTACTAGICYEVLPFEGFELRLTSNF